MPGATPPTAWAARARRLLARAAVLPLGLVPLDETLAEAPGPRRGEARADISLREQRVREFPDLQFDGDRQASPTRGVETVLEDGQVLHFPRLAFPLAAGEARFLNPRWADGKAKNISVRWPAGTLRGAAGGDDDLAALRALIVRFAEHSEALVLRLFPHYRGHLQRGNTSLRPAEIAGRPTGWRKDDTRLHVDAFPSNPTQGTRLLRVFTNVNPHGKPRRWRVGEPFDAHALRWLPSLTWPLPGSAALLEQLHITKRRRTPYDHLMLQLHDHAKADLAFQRDSPQTHIDFAPGSTWVVFSDQVPHAAMSGQHMLEQTFLLKPEHLQRPETAPVHRLERLVGRALR